MYNKNISKDDVEFLRGCEIQHKCYIEFGANVTFEKATLIGFTPSGKRVRIIKDDRVMNVKLENIFVKAV